jgi:hypothetical protein
METYAVLRRIDIDGGELLTKDQLPSNAVATGKLRHGFPEYVYSTTSCDLGKAYVNVAISGKLV